MASEERLTKPAKGTVIKAECGGWRPSGCVGPECCSILCLQVELSGSVLLLIKTALSQWLVEDGEESTSTPVVVFNNTECTAVCMCANATAG